LWYPANIARFLPEILQWLSGGCRGPAPHPLKLIIINSYLRRLHLEAFVETGTYLGETLEYIARSGVPCTSIELSPQLFAGAQKRFKRFSNVVLKQGDSAQQLPIVLDAVFCPTLFWLDGHYSAGITVGSALATPIGSELSAILRHPIKDHVILIDDARCFNGEGGYPRLDELLREVRENGSYSAEVSADIIRLTPLRERTH
jgi:hypothetical protein